MSQYDQNFQGIQIANAPSSSAAQKTFDTSNLSAVFSGLASFWTSYDAAKNAQAGGLANPPAPPAENKTWKYVGIGLLVAAVLGIIIFAATKK